MSDAILSEIKTHPHPSVFLLLQSAMFSGLVRQLIDAFDSIQTNTASLHRKYSVKNSKTNTDCSKSKLLTPQMDLTKT